MSDTESLLCTSCENLNLSTESFKGSQNAQNGDCTPDDLSSKGLASGAAPIPYVISENTEPTTQCKLCSLIRKTIASYEHPVEHPVTEYTIQWELDGPYVEDSSNFISTCRRLKVSWTRKAGTPAAARKTNADAVRSEPSVESLREVKEEFYLLAARGLPQQSTEPTSTGTQQGDAKSLESNESMVLDWLAICEKEHKKQHPLSQGKWKGQFRELVQSGYFGVIDVVDKRLCQLPILEDGEPAPYVALSYVWGKRKEESSVESDKDAPVASPTNLKALPTPNNPGPKKEWEKFHTISENVMARTEARGLEEDWQTFPQTIGDALKLVQDLGRRRKEEDGQKKPELRYIWIDSVCIVQDRGRSWSRNAKHMHLIYGNAYFTICAADGADSAAGLKALRLARHQQSQYAQITPDVRVRVFRSSKGRINASEWNRRGWTFQEYILSRRCLVFTGGQVYFQCQQTNWSPGDDPKEVRNGMASEWRVLPHRAYEELGSKPIKFFMTAVETYTGRNLTLPTDILNAFSGVSQLMEHYLCSHLNFGLPASHFDLALLWKPLAGKCRRQNLESSHGRDEFEFPSWSWCGWMDSTDHGKGAGVVYEASFLDGCLGDIRDWLLNHTWIIWYVRDREGDVLPSWEGPTVPPSSRGTVATKWQGYKSRPRRQASCWVRHLDVPENVAIGKHVDDYGRPNHKFWWHDLAKDQSPSQFRERLTDNPFGVRGPSGRYTRSYMFFDGHDNHSGNYMAFGEVGLDRQPFQPILQFWTLTSEFQTIIDKQCPVKGRLQRLDIVDGKCNKCGTVVVDSNWAETRVNVKDYSPIKFIALSEAKCIPEQEWHSDCWSDYNGKAREDSDWSFFYVMAVTKDQTRGVWERLGLGKVFQLAFKNVGCRWEEIILG